MVCLFWALAIILVMIVLAYHRASLTVFALAGFITLLLVTVLSPFSLITKISLWLIYLVVYVPLLLPQIRRNVLSKYFLDMYKKVMPKMSLTEKQAIAAGTVIWAGELFSGSPNWQSLLQKSAAKLTEEEQAFLDGPVEKLCQMTDDWDITHRRMDMPEEVWEFIKKEGFFGLIIPKSYGGKEFSAAAHSAIIIKASSCGITVASTIAVPNSLGPAELLLHYGTEDQKNYYLPKLASGEEIPCFALTGPEAGSDAAAIPDTGIVCKGVYDGKEIIGIKLNFSKRYITLAPVATVIGLAFKMYDPDHLIGQKENIGITCALIPRHIKGVSIGRRHYPLNIAFQNGPIFGKDVFVPLDFIIGGQKMAGQGWRMLIECLSVGRGITLPSMAVGGSKVAALASGAYSRIRKQFGMSIGLFEGIEEALTRIAANAYVINAICKFTIAAIDRGEKPAVLTAISKYHTTTRARACANDAMDIHGGKGICLGPRNYVGRSYQGVPISITVEGANILTRSMIIFGQGAIRCHPYVLKEMDAAANKDQTAGLFAFDKSIFGHLGFIISNMVRSFVLGVTGSKIVLTPSGNGRCYFQQFTRFSSALALLTDFSMAFIGGDLKRREKISARLGDILSMLYLGSSVLKYYYEQGQLKEDLPLLNWTCQELLYTAQLQVDGVLRNFPNRFVAAILRFLIFPFGRNFSMPSDKLGHRLAALLVSPSDTRSRLTAGIYLGTKGHNPIGRMEEVFQKIIAAEEIEKKINKANAKQEITGHTFGELIDAAVVAKIITEAEAKQMQEAYAARLEVIAVDDFDPSELMK